MAKLGSFGSTTDDAKSKPKQETIKAQKNGATDLDATVETFAYPELEQERELYAKWQDQYEQETVDTQPTDQEIIAATSTGQSVTDRDVERLRNIMGTAQNDWFGVPDLGLSPEFAIDRNLFGDINGYLTSNQAGFNAAINALPSTNPFGKVITGGIYDIARGVSGFAETLSNDFWGTSKQIALGIGSLIEDFSGARNGDALAAYRLYERGSNAFDGAVGDFSSFIDNFGKGLYAESGADISGYLSVPTGGGLAAFGVKGLIDVHSAVKTVSTNQIKSQNVYGMDIISDLGESHARSFSHADFGDVEPGLYYQIQRQGQERLGSYFLPVKPVDSLDAEIMTNIMLWGNNADKITTVRINLGLQSWQGGVQGGTGSQLMIPYRFHEPFIETISTEPLYKPALQTKAANWYKGN